MQEKKHTKLPLYQRVRKMLLSGILLALLLSLGASFALNMIQESRTREQTLSSAVQMAANSPILMADINQARSGDYIQRAVVNVSSLDLFAVYDKDGQPVAFYDLATEYNISLKSITHVSVISDRLPLLNEGKVEGAIAIFRNRTEVTKLAQDLTGVQHIVEALRANTHEFTNKLHVILGLLQLGETEKAEEYVQQITETRTQSIGYVADRIKDSSVAALLIGKAYRAAELGITFTLDPASALQGSGQFLPLSGLITVLGNLIENAFDALQGAPSDVPSEVTVSIREGARGLLLSVDDTGPGMTQEVQQHIFERGFSTKGEGRGTGLSLVKDTLDAYNGTIRVESEPGVGTSFIITLNDRSQP